MEPRLSIHDLSLWCLLGCYAEERAQKQEVRVSLDLELVEAPLACQSDRLEDTFCYASLCDSMKAVVEGRAFQTIEYLSQQIVLKLVEKIPKRVRWRFKLHKLNPPIDGLKGGVSFELRGQT